MNTAANTPPQRDQLDDGAHVYRVSAANRAAVVVLGVMQFCLAGWLGSGLFVPHIRARFVHQGLNATADLVVTLAVLGLALFSTIRPFQMRVTIMNSQVEVVGAFSSKIIPFAEISGRRSAGGWYVRGMYLYRRGKSRVFVRESMLPLDNFYERWKASIYDLDMADRLKRKAAGEESPMDYILGAADCEQHPVIGGPDTIA